jgi:signal transduction histidine kinase
VMRNLLSNAVKFSPDGGEISVMLEFDVEGARVTVADCGPGIPPEELELVFDKFVQSSKTKSGSGGTGLGLAICRQIVAAHRGRIWAANGEQGGALVIFEIPLEQPEAALEAEELLGAAI